MEKGLKELEEFMKNVSFMQSQALLNRNIYELPHDKTNKMTCAPSEDSDLPGYPPSLIKVFAIRMKKAWVLSYPVSEQQRLWSDWADAQADLRLRWAHRSFCWFCHEAAQYYFRGELHKGSTTKPSVAKHCAMVHHKNVLHLQSWRYVAVLELPQEKRYIVTYRCIVVRTKHLEEHHKKA